MNPHLPSPSSSPSKSGMYGSRKHWIRSVSCNISELLKLDIATGLCQWYTGYKLPHCIFAVFCIIKLPMSVIKNTHHSIINKQLKFL